MPLCQKQLFLKNSPTLNRQTHGTTYTALAQRRAGKNQQPNFAFVFLNEPQ